MSTRKPTAARGASIRTESFTDRLKRRIKELKKQLAPIAKKKHCVLKDRLKGAIAFAEVELEWAEGSAERAKKVPNKAEKEAQKKKGTK